MSTIGDDLLRESGELLRRRPPFGPKIEALVVYNSNPVAVAPESTQGRRRASRREDLFTVVLEHFMTDTADHADYVLPATTQLEHLDVHASLRPHLRADQRAGDRAARARPGSNTQIFRELARAMGFDEPAFADDDETLARIAFEPAAEGGVDFADLRARGWVKLPIAEAPFADGGFPTPNGKCRIDVPGLGLPDHVPNYESAQSTPELARRFPLAMISPPARNFLNSTFVNVTQPARDRGRAGARDPIRATPPRAASPTASAVRIFNDRGEYRCKARGRHAGAAGRRQRPGRLVAQARADGSNVNELTHQRLTDIGRAPSFYDCLVEVERAGATASA